MSELFEKIKKIIDINQCDFQIKDTTILVHINLPLEKKIDKEENQKIKEITNNYFHNISKYKDHEIKIIFSRSNDAISENLMQNNVQNKQEKQIKSKQKAPGVHNIILVASGKGGVGKSTIAANVAISLAKIGWKVGLLDADIYGASIPTIFEIHDKNIELDNKGCIIPIEKYDVKINSIDFVTEDNEALIWRGPMISKILNQLLKNTAWGEIDYLIIDTPPGTGDIHLTLLENYQIDGYLLTSTPHTTSIKNTKKTQEMFEKFNIKNCGLIINMSHMEDNSEIKLFKKENLDILSYNKIFELPFFLNQENSLFCLKQKNEKIFIDIARCLVKI